MRADDDGFVNSPKKIMRMVGASPDDLNILALRKFIIPFDNGVVVIKHWKIHNYIQNDRYHETSYKELKDMLELDENKAYRLPKSDEDVPCIQDGYNMDTQVRLGKDSIGKSNNTPLPPNGGKGVFIPPTLEEVEDYCKSRNSPVDPKQFWEYFDAGNWIDSKGQKVRSWKQKLITWEKGGYGNAGAGKQSGTDERTRKIQELRNKYDGVNFYDNV